MFADAARPARQSPFIEPSTVSCDAVAAWTVVIRPCLIPHLSFTVFTSAAINVERPTASCSDDQDDQGERNDTIPTATDAAPGSYARNICDPADGFDADYFKINVANGKRLIATLSFDAAAGDLDLYLVDATEDVIRYSEEVTSPEYS